MALTTRHWILATLLGCALVVAAYLPPTVSQRWLALEAAKRRDPETAAQTRAASHLRDNVERWIVLSERDSLLSQSRRAGLKEDAAPKLILRGDASPEARRRLNEIVQSVWSKMAGNGSGVRFRFVGVTLRSDIVTGAGDLANALQDWYTLLPSVTDGRTCVAVVPDLRVADSLLTRSWWKGNMRGTVAAAAAPCALYAVFGPPGPAVGRWLEARSFSLAAEPDWALGGFSGPGAYWWDPYQEDPQQLQGRLPSIFTRIVGELPPGYYASPDGAACASGDLARCRHAVLDSVPIAGDVQPPLKGIIRHWRWWGWDNWRYFGRSYVSDLIREMGPDRFRRFWTSSLPVDSAFAQAMGLPMEEWTHRWLVGRLQSRDQIGVSFHPIPTLVGLLTAGLLLGATALGTRRREVA